MHNALFRALANIPGKCKEGNRTLKEEQISRNIGEHETAGEQDSLWAEPYKTLRVGGTGREREWRTNSSHRRSL